MLDTKGMIPDKTRLPQDMILVLDPASFTYRKKLSLNEAKSLSYLLFLRMSKNF